MTRDTKDYRIQIQALANGVWVTWPEKFETLHEMTYRWRQLARVWGAVRRVK